LAATEKHIVEGRKHIERQRQIIARQVLEGDDQVHAEQLLTAMEQSQVLHEQYCDWLRQQLGLPPVR